MSSGNQRLAFDGGGDGGDWAGEGAEQRRGLSGSGGSSPKVRDVHAIWLALPRSNVFWHLKPVDFEDIGGIGNFDSEFHFNAVYDFFLKSENQIIAVHVQFT